MFRHLFLVQADITSAQYLLSAISQCSAAILAIILTIKIVVPQIGKYRLPLPYILKINIPEAIILGLFFLAIISPLMILALGAYCFVNYILIIFIISILAIFYYAAIILRKNQIDTFLEYCIKRKRNILEVEIYDLCLQAMSNHDLAIFKKSLIALTCIPKRGLCWSTIRNYHNRIAAKTLDNMALLETFLEGLYIYTSPIARMNISMKKSRVGSLIDKVRLYFEILMNKPDFCKIVAKNIYFREDSINSTHSTLRTLLKTRNPDIQKKVYETFLNIFYDHFVASNLIEKGFVKYWESTLNSIDLKIFESWLRTIPYDSTVKFLEERNSYSAPPIIMYTIWMSKKAKQTLQKREKTYKDIRGIAWNNFVNLIKEIKKRETRAQQEFEIQLYDNVEKKFIKSNVVF